MLKFNVQALQDRAPVTAADLLGHAVEHVGRRHIDLVTTGRTTKALIALRMKIATYTIGVYDLERQDRARQIVNAFTSRLEQAEADYMLAVHTYQPEKLKQLGIIIPDDLEAAQQSETTLSL